MNYPFENTSIIDLPSEIWKDIKDFEGYHKVSNLGRVKSLDRVIPHPRLYRQFVKGRILKQKVVIDKNSIHDEGMVSLQVALCRENTMQYKNVRRLVYDSFVKPINYKKDGLYVINTDGNGYNNQVDNLKLVTKSEKSARAFDRGRVPESFLKTADRSKWKKNTSNWKKMAQIDLNTGAIIKVFDSIRQASTELKLDEKEIINTAKGRRDSYKGFGWKYENK